MNQDLRERCIAFSVAMIKFVEDYEYALKSSNETKYWLRLIQETLEIKATGVHLKEVEEISNIIASIIIKLKGIRF